MKLKKTFYQRDDVVQIAKELLGKYLFTKFNGKLTGGIITETGGALSHPAITAREYGIPAVVAVRGATSRIKDGDVVTIDGGRGIVSLR